MAASPLQRYPMELVRIFTVPDDWVARAFGRLSFQVRMQQLFDQARTVRVDHTFEVQDTVDFRISVQNMI